MNTYNDFMIHVIEVELDGPARMFVKFEKCISRSTLRFWKHIVRMEPGYEADHCTPDTFTEAIELLRNKFCGEANMGKTQMYYLAHDCKKPSKMTP
jgi:hypothetical protein